MSFQNGSNDDHGTDDDDAEEDSVRRHTEHLTEMIIFNAAQTLSIASITVIL